MEMRVKHFKVLPMLLILTMFLTVLSTTAYADEKHIVNLPVTVTLSGSPPTNDEDYKINLIADDSANPMPGGSEDGVYSLIIRGAKTVNFPKIEYSSLGIYKYTINQSPGSNRLATYDDTTYRLVVYVTNAEEGNALETTVVLYNSGETGKLEKVIFNNKYKARPIPPPPIEEPPEEEPPEEEPPVEEPPEEEPPEEEPPEEEPPSEEPPEEEPKSPPVSEDPPKEEPKSPTPVKPDVPQTSDETVVWPYLGLFISGAMMLFVLGVRLVKRRIED